MHTDEFVNITRVPTRIITEGKWLTDPLDDVTELAICITGNPGVVGFYKPFAELLHNNLNNSIPVWVIGHKGHDEPPASSFRQVPQLKGNEELFDLKSQIEHKIEFIEQNVPEHVKIHLIGHSIGCWMVLQMLREERIRSRIIKCYLLFPTIERMMESPNGWIFTKIVLPLYSVFGFIITLFNYISADWRKLFIYIYFWFAAIPRIFAETALIYAKASIVEKVVFLAEDEMARVRGLQHDVLQQYGSLLSLFYGTTDGWVPVEYYEQLCEKYPNLDAELDTKQIDHSFVLRHNEIMAEIVSKKIIKNSHLFNNVSTPSE